MLGDLPSVRAFACHDNSVDGLFNDMCLEGVVGKLQIRHQFGQAVLQWMRYRQFAQGDLRAILQGMAYMSRQFCFVDHHLRVQRRRIQVTFARCQRNIGNNRLDCRRV